ncbi:MAG: hypothetical protein KGN76_18470 [Acidobacteriota bacterium]|nr:hypothetical protein [Acidobacteriota bacterium]
MPIIKPRTHGRRFVRQRVILDCQNEDTLCAYAAFIGEDPHYVVNALIETVLARDREFQTWRTEHPQASVSLARRASRKRASSGDGETRGESDRTATLGGWPAHAGQRG